MTTIIGSHGSGVSLTSAADNPVTIADGASITTAAGGPALYCGYGVDWTVTNYGVVTSPGNNGSGIFLATSGVVNNMAGAIISGKAVGVEAYGADITVYNFGLISGSGTANSYGVVLWGVNSNTLINDQDGRYPFSTVYISGAADGVVVEQGSAYIRNATDITGTANDGVLLISGGTVNNDYGQITGGQNGVAVKAGGTVSNSGYIYGLNGVSIDGANASVSNTGTISANYSLPGPGDSGTGVVLTGSLVNSITNSGDIFGGSVGASVSGAPATIANSAYIGGNDVGIVLNNGGHITNSAGAIISAYYRAAVAAYVNPYNINANATIVTGAGSQIYSRAGDGIYLGSGGIITNGGTIHGAPNGIYDYIGTLLVTNSGVIVATGGAGVNFGVSPFGGVTGTVTNGGSANATARIEGNSYGIEGSGALTVTNFGTIIGHNGAAIEFGGDSGDKLVVEPGAVFTGIVIDAGGIDEIDFIKSGTIALHPEYFGFSTVRLSNIAANSLSLSDTDFTGLATPLISVFTGKNGDTVNAAALSSGKRVNITGGAGPDQLTGGAGNDTLHGGLGNDSLNGGAGADTMGGGVGNDSYFVDNTGDVVTEASAAGIDTVKTTLLTYTLSANVENLTFAGVGNFAGTGNALGNIITGGAGNDTLHGGVGNDALHGGAGADSMAGGSGNDTYFVDNAGDIVTEITAAGIDTVSTSLTHYTLGANVEKLVYAGAVNFTGTGNALDNTITGGVGNDTLIGGGGNDTLVGGLGNDTLTGGTGNDSFLFDTALNATTNVDHIIDFTTIGDRILLKHAIFAEAGPVGTLASDAFHIGSAAADATDRIIYNSTTGALTYDSNGNDAGGAQRFATLSTGLALTNADFIIVA